MLLGLPLVVLAPEGRREAMEAGGGVGDASPGSTKFRLCLGNASCVWRSSLDDSSVVQSPEVSAALSSSAPSVEHVTALGNPGANVDRSLWLNRFDPLPCVR